MFDNRAPTDDERTLDDARDAVAEARVGRDVVFAGLDRINGIESFYLDDDTLRVTVSLPAPSAMFQLQVEHEIQTAVADVDGVADVLVGWNATAADTGTRVDAIPNVKNVLGVASGKGGVGKSTMAVNLAVALADAGADVGLLDADVYGPNAPRMLGLAGTKPPTTRDDMMVPREAHDVKVMSMGFIVEEDDPVIWRGPLVDEFVKQLFDDVRWGALDYLVVDLPPGTGDTQLSLVQHFPVTGTVVVTTPQSVAVDDARRGLQGFVRYDVPVLGVVENMAGFECPDCGTAHDVFGDGGGRRLADEFDVPLLGQVPLDPAVGTLGADDDANRTRDLSIPGLGRLRLPRTRAERERPDSVDPIAIREGPTETRAAARRFATRTAARVNALSNLDPDPDT